MDCQKNVKRELIRQNRRAKRALRGDNMREANRAARIAKVWEARS